MQMKRQPQRADITLAAERVMSKSTLIAKQPLKHPESHWTRSLWTQWHCSYISMHRPMGHNNSFFSPRNFLPILEKYPLNCLQLASCNLCAATPHEAWREAEDPFSVLVCYQTVVWFVVGFFLKTKHGPALRGIVKRTVNRSNLMWQIVQC